MVASLFKLIIGKTYVTNIAISVGGSGHKALEALILLCAAGLGPETLDVVCIEPETDNGNFRRTEELLDSYRKLYLFFRGTTNRMGDKCSLFRTRINYFLRTKLQWSPIGDGQRGTTLAELFREQQMRSNPVRAGEALLFDSLFRRQREAGSGASEQETTLIGGFRGRPPIGVAVLAEAAQHTDDILVKEITERIARAREGEPPRIFLFGSVFGGTGASCMPGLARLIRTQGGRMPIGAAFLLPYFTFGSTDKEELAADSAEFLRQTKGALSYYATTLEAADVFNQIFLLGAPKLAVMPPAQTGPQAGKNPIYGPEQKNPPLVIELFAALAGCRFPPFRCGS